ncbi:MAG: phosphoglycolate phosphatase [Comamonas sp.]
MTRPLSFTPAAIAAAAIDLDGTLVDTLGDFHAAVTAMLAELSLPAIAREAVAGYIGKGTEHLLHSVLRHVAPQAGLDADAAEALYAAAWGHYMAHYATLNGQHAQVYPGVAEGLHALRAQGLPLACLTNKPEAFARALLARKGLDGFFAHIAGGDTYEFKKPHPLPLQETARALGVAPAAMLMVGDSVNDAQAARAAGCPVVLVPYGYSHGLDVATLDSDGVVADLAALARALQGQAWSDKPSPLRPAGRPRD